MGTSDVFPGRIGIVMLGVNDLARAVEFYRGTLAVKFRNQVENIAFFDAGAVTLCLNGGLAQAAGAAGGAEYVFPVNHVRAAYDWLRARGVQFIREPHNVTGTSWAANFRDPDGHLLSVFGPE